jgi:hypothetical protein
MTRALARIFHTDLLRRPGRHMRPSRHDQYEISRLEDMWCILDHAMTNIVQ